MWALLIRMYYECRNKAVVFLWQLNVFCPPPQTLYHMVSNTGVTNEDRSILAMWDTPNSHYVKKCYNTKNLLNC